jgi:divalent metal cation (Fe/Co/Zn/Cd) transporter
LAVLPAVAGSLLGLPILDPIFGILIGIAIIFITWNATKSIWYRMMDAVDPGLTDQTRMLITRVPGVQGIQALHLRWVGHDLWIEGRVKVDRSLGLAQIEDLMKQITKELEDQIHNLGEVILSIA